MAKKRGKVNLVIQLDNVLLNDTIRKDLDNWISSMTEDAERELDPGEIISKSWWEEVND